MPSDTCDRVSSVNVKIHKIEHATICSFECQCTNGGDFPHAAKPAVFCKQ